jgi:hypothetical protein
LFGGANVNQRLNSTHTVFETGGLDGNFGVSLLKGDDSYSVALQVQNFNVDNSRFRDAAGLTAQWLHNLDDSSQASAYFQFTDLHYPGQDTRDALRYVLGAAYARTLGGEYAPTVYGGGYVGQENERRANVPYLGHKLYGLRAGGEMRVSSAWTLFGSLSMEKRDYGGPDPLFLVNRGDTQADLRLGLSYVPLQQWTVTPSLSYTRNNSNIVVSDYDRTVITVSVRRDFN